MDTALHRKIKSMCYTTRDGSGHWILQGSRTVWVAETQEVVTTKRAAYAAFRGEIPGGMDVRSDCGMPGCISPGHAVLCESRRVARPLSLPDQLLELAKPEKFRPPDQPNSLPKGLSLRMIETVRYLTKEGNTIEQIRSATQLSSHEVMRVRGGIYDGIADVLAGSRNSRRGYKDSRLARSAAEISGDTLPGAVAAVQDPSGPPKVANEVEISEEEAAWLSQIGKG
jgi:hypothetical protein